MKHTINWNKITDFSGLNTVENILDNVSAQLNKIYKKVNILIWIFFTRLHLYDGGS